MTSARRAANERPQQLRLFVACALPDDVLRAIGEVQDALRRATDPFDGAQGRLRLRWTRPEGIHITLKFLGAVDAGRVGEIESALAPAIEPFELQVRPAGLEGFPPQAGLRVVWLGLEGEVEGLAVLAERVGGALGPLGFPREHRPFAAHLTLARVPDEAPPDERRRLARLLQEQPPAGLPGMVLEHVHLVRSTLRPGGAVYERLATFPRR